ncbi:HET-domain-containing protein [Canariomyces notabilis]|uniref:HET-domain-containing protein n=1 Tax=Canariomyces notabilis TaxID=2074819 RepID=A0AAN6QF71_9PEZI|nr:HET-domain-containing protein [Canariomyces arenarius]
MLYVALSYCWGAGTHSHKTTKENTDERLKSFTLAALPKTIQDAVEITRKLGFRSLWIDSLCIVQDDEGDVANQLGDMHKIYTSAALTVSAANASGSDEGFLSVCWPASQSVRLRYKTPNREEGHVILSKYFRPGGEPIHTRAWTLQEHLLSTRTLIYGTHGLRWSCRTAKYYDVSQNQPDIPTAADLSSGIRNWATWYEIVQEFSSRKLSFPQDRLPAISAIAAKYSEAGIGRYLAELWESTLARDLLWGKYGGLKEGSRDQPAGFPSWSWASLGGPVRWGDMPFKGTPPTFTLLGARVTTTSPPTPFGQVASGTLRIQGHLRPVTCLATGADACSNKLWPREVYFPHPWDERAVLLAGANLMQNEQEPDNLNAQSFSRSLTARKI